ncbi:MAG TPA: sialidase family protein [Gemmatimonadaceae bacterium]|jgi:hypothetical protein
MRGAGVRAAAIVGLAMLALGCDRPPVTWQEVARTAGALAADTRLTLDANGAPAIGARPTAPFVTPAGACAASLVFARLGAGEWYAAWWQPRADSSASLVVARSINSGNSWTPPMVADARDHSSLGCARPAPAIAADSASGYVHLVYFLAAPQGTGIWFTHSMEHGAIWHAPVGILFGDDPARASVAAHGDTVVVAYEYPNADEGRVGIAISSTTGHIFEWRVPVSATTEQASDPRVAVRGRRVAVAWASRAIGASGDAAPAATVVDVGTLTQP